MEFREKLVVLRKKNKMTQLDLANAVEVTRQSVYKWETGKSYPGAETLFALKHLFGVSIDIMLDPACDLPEEISTSVNAEETKKAEPTVEKAEETQSPVEEEVKAEPEKQEDETAPEAEAPATVAEPLSETPSVEAKEETHSAQEPDGDAKKKKGFLSRIFGR